MTKQLLILSFLFLASCGPQNTSSSGFNSDTERPSIVGGQTVKNEIFAKHVVALFNQKSGILCTATLITPNIVLTAAHCANADNVSDHFVVFSKTLQVPRGPVFRQATARKIHDYNPKAFYNRKDLALVRFHGTVPAGFEPMSLPSPKDFQSIGKSFYAAGYGSVTARKDVGNRQNGILRYAQLNILEKKLSPDLPQFTVKQVGGKGICHGDSGGPAFVNINGRRILVGVASAVYTFDKNPERRTSFDLCRHFSIYISTYYYLNWIRKASAALSH